MTTNYFKSYHHIQLYNLCKCSSRSSYLSWLFIRQPVLVTSFNGRRK